MAKNFDSGDSWIAGVIAQQLGPLTYLVDVSGGRLWKRYVDHLKEFNPPPPSSTIVPETEVDIDLPPFSTSIRAEDVSDAIVPPEPTPDANETNTPESDLSPPPKLTPSRASSVPEMTPTPPRQYPSRSHRPPARFDTQT